MVADAVRLDARMIGADVVLTGEGAVDASSFGGKVTGEVARRARSLGVRCVIVAGRVDVSQEWLTQNGVHVVPLSEGSPPEVAVGEAAREALRGLLD
jgi:glycerate kinase